MRKHRRPSMAEVAKVAGVSHQTVSRVINGFEGVRPTTRQKVEAAIEQLGYRPNLAARALVTAQSRTIGVIAVGSFLYGPSRTLATISEVARSHGYAVLIASIREAAEEEFAASIDDLLNGAVAAIIVIGARESLSRYAGHLDTDTPIIMVGPPVDSVPNLPSVSVDQGSGARTAIRHLIQLGHTDILLLAGPHNWTDAQWRRKAAIAECETASITPRIIEGDWSPRAGYDTGVWISSLAPEDRPTAVFSANDQMALGLLAAFLATGIDVPGDISVIGFDNVPESEFYSPALTTITQDFTELGHRVLEATLALLEGKDPDVTPIPANLVVRQSTARKKV
ncbi:DNA-binding transcriptional regulator, LacI/PurR family [Actinobaculum suis]|uniref:DNA-binding transcriptional regulator, LacI/PurR family n=1 Tax=Actinobaculum suis TaxID=1657 RepID=A0A0K9EQY9_9ACTO|nr:LacI family DNA-binding transcriptional regulator [Actinobaculum suis]KMY22583.1 hypothetical protein ACU19_09200 [Actinobaculum suis]MDY5152867.1 LacI family DNA-binding transcriptional regulator [Actinobaculum suis]OCA93601.1 hypothetical protein ACU20_08620 [Actinobaculum suis]OCA93877.1 hypothetical protein ACU21_08930 [Actinobaculum suis]SDE55040.1 DNA-binding transcriptional regulator, LacI/PurR family [Actinobaculum suis]